VEQDTLPASPAAAGVAQRKTPKNIARKNNLPKVFISGVSPA
jgi:hypothetical protein